MDYGLYYSFLYSLIFVPDVVQSHKRATVNAMAVDSVLIWGIKYFNIFHSLALVTRQSAALSSANQHAMSLVFGGKWARECLNTKFPGSHCYVWDTA